MPNRYEREIEEILTRMEESEPNKGSGDKIRPFRRPKPQRQRPQGLPAPHISLMELLFLLAIALILIASGLAFYDGAASPLSAIIMGVGALLFLVALVAGWRDRFRPSPPPQWRRSALDDDNRPHGPFGGLAGRVRIWRLRRDYRRGQATRRRLDD